MSIWFRPTTIEQVHATFSGVRDINVHLDIRVTEIGDDFLGSTASNLCLDTSKFYAVGQEISANHLRSARSGRVTGTARPVHLGGRSQVWDIQLQDEAGRLTCVSRLTMAVIAAPGRGMTLVGKEK